MSDAAILAPTLPSPTERLRRLAPGIALAAAIAGLGVWLGGMQWPAAHGFSALTVAIVLGMAVGNIVPPARLQAFAPGIGFSKQTLLRAGVVLYGLRLTLQDVAHVGWAGIAIDALVLGSTFGLACWIGTRWLGLDRRTAMLIGAGSAICGAAAVMATEPVVEGRAEQVAVAVATVVVFGTLAIFAYPLLYELNQSLGFIRGGETGFGIYAGSTIHEVAQVVAAARAVGPEAADTAVIAKMVRVMMLAPFLMLLAAWLARDAARRPRALSAGARSMPRRGTVPWFAFGFVAVVLFHSWLPLPMPAVAAAIDADTALLATAMAALGMATRLGEVRRAGARPLLLAALLFGWLVVGGAAISHGVAMLAG